MSAFFDTNVLVYAVDPSSGLKHHRADALVAEHLLGRSLVISTQVLQETYSVLTRKKQVSPDIALRIVEMHAQETVVPSSASFVLDALVLSQRYQLSVWDGLIVQAALQARCDVLFSEDLQAGMRFGALEVVNPFDLSVQQPAVAYRSRGRRPRATVK